MGGQWASPTQGPWPFHPRTLAGGKGQGAGQVEAETLRRVRWGAGHLLGGEEGGGLNPRKLISPLTLAWFPSR